MTVDNLIEKLQTTPEDALKITVEFLAYNYGIFGVNSRNSTQSTYKSITGKSYKCKRGSYLMYVDASFKHQTGETGYAIIVQDSNGNEVHSHPGVHICNNSCDAEEMAIASGVRWCKNIEPYSNIIIYSDAMNVIDKFPTSKYKTLYENRKSFHNIEIKHIPGKKNPADKIAKKALSDNIRKVT